MTPGARVAAAIAVLDQIQAGAAAEQALTAWASCQPIDRLSEALRRRVCPFCRA